MEKYELVRDIGSGNFAVARLMRDKETKELVAMKYIQRGQKVCWYRNYYLISFFICVCLGGGSLDDGLVCRSMRMLRGR